MPIIYDENSRIFKLDTPDSSYAFYITDEKMLYHVYYGKRIEDIDLRYLMGISPSFLSGTIEHNGPGLSGFKFEYAPYGMGDFSESCLMVKDAHGNVNCDVRYKGHSIFSGKKKLDGLPAAFENNDGEITSLEVYCEDKLTGLQITIKYSVFEKLDAITRSVELGNRGKDNLIVERALSSCIELPKGKYDIISLPGGWARERHPERCRIAHGSHILSSEEGKTSHGMNNFFAVCRDDANEDYGEVYGSCLVYSGNFTCGTRMGDSETVRIFSGINPVGFEWKLTPGEKFQTPEVIHVFSSEGLGAMSRTYHKLLREHIIRSRWKNKRRPVLINNWEATYFDFDTERLIEIAAQAHEAGIEMLVMDDGWFGHRDNDLSSLGDWYVNEEKLKGGLEYLVGEVNKLGMKFGIWFEPEMISPDSKLYKEHPDWCLHVNGRERHLSRTQLVLDFSRKEVRDCIYTQMKKILSCANIEYVKWDHNRSFTDVGNDIEEFSMQSSLAHKCILGLYEVQERLITDFPNLLLENCSGGGGRFDAGMLYYSPQIWTSDDTDAYERLAIQHGTSLCYPCSSFGSHVSVTPNHQVYRVTPMETRAAVAMTGTFGYELDITKMNDEEKAKIRDQVNEYKRFAELTANGDYYRLSSSNSDNYSAWQFVSSDKKEALLQYVRVLNHVYPVDIIRLKGLSVDALYEDDNGKRYSGALLMNAGVPMNVPNGDFTCCTMHFCRVN